MNIHLPAPRHRWPARLVILAVVVVVLALAAATFVLSYTGVHVIALQAGVSARFARLYPATFDAVLVVACVAAVMLRDARWWVRTYAWLVIILVVAVVGAADAVHAMNLALEHRTMEGVVAAAPWVLALIGFSLLLTILRHSRAQHAAAVPDSVEADLGEYRSPAPALLLVEPDATFVSEADQAAPAIEAPAEAEATPEPDGGSIASADPDGYEDAGAPVPDPAEGPGEAAVSWHRHWDPAQEPDPDRQTDAAVEDPEDQRHLPPPVEPGDRTPEEVDLDAPPFATAPFATVPRLNRVRSTPTPPEEL